MRKIHDVEKAVLEYLIKQGEFPVEEDWDKTLLVQPMDDGGMGSFSIYQNETDIATKRKFGKQISEFEFIDDDGVPVLVSLYVDKQNRLLEVDVWKINFIPVLNLKIPPENV